MTKVRIEYHKTASHNIEPQKGFTNECPAELPVPEGHLIVPELRGQNGIVAWRTISKEIHPPNAVWIADAAHPQLSPVEGENVDFRWNSHCISGTQGAELIGGMDHISHFHFIVAKGFEPDIHPYSSCFHDYRKTISTGFIEWLRDKDIDTVIVAGLATNYCVAATCRDLSEAGFRVILNLGGSRGIGSQAEIDRCLEELVRQYGVITVSSYNEIELTGGNEG
jgi:nicotinamidase/pyrazinamidase